MSAGDGQGPHCCHTQYHYWGDSPHQGDWRDVFKRPFAETYHNPNPPINVATYYFREQAALDAWHGR